MDVDNQIAKLMMVLSCSQDYEIGDGTTAVMDHFQSKLSNCWNMVFAQLGLPKATKWLFMILFVWQGIWFERNLLFMVVAHLRSCSIAIKTASDFYPGVGQVLTDFGRNECNVSSHAAHAV